jgi:hypothetical protein
MDERQKIQVENLREYLKLYHQLLLLLVAVSVTFFLFSWKFDAAREIQFYETGIPMNLAWVGALVLFLCFAGFARATLDRAARILEELKSSDLLDVILQYPSAATDRSPVVRLGSVILPLLLFLGGLCMEFIRESRPSGTYDWTTAGIVGFFTLITTGCILTRVRQPLGSHRRS